MPRQAIPNHQKIALREHNQKHPFATQNQLTHWFYKAYNHRLSQSTLSAILFPKYRHLDTDPTEYLVKAKRYRTAKWLDLEAALIYILDHPRLAPDPNNLGGYSRESTVFPFLGEKFVCRPDIYI